jgi:hypothetical protein
MHMFYNITPNDEGMNDEREKETRTILTRIN